MSDGLNRRFESLEEKMDQETKESASFRGEVREFMRNQTAYLGAVSAKVDRSNQFLEDHQRDLDAHGAGGERRANKALMAWSGLAFAGIEALSHGRDILELLGHFHR